MNIEKAKKAKINGIEIPVIVDNRALVDYKRDKGNSQVLDLEDVLKQIWYGIKSGARRSGLEFKMTFDQFVDYTSDNEDCLPADEPATEPVEDDKKKGSTT